MTQSGFHIDKWFLDVICDSGETMIFYSATLSWRGITVPYMSWLLKKEFSQATRKTRFSNQSIPSISGDEITFSDSKWKFSGKWRSLAPSHEARLFESSKGYLDWMCYQPASSVTLKHGERTISGTGYAERLILTAYPWEIPMDELRWGRFKTDDHYAVWVELRQKSVEQWVWLDGQKVSKAEVSDKGIQFLEEAINIKFDQGEILESDTTIYSVVDKLIKFIPGFKSFMPLSFLMAVNFKWRSNAILTDPIMNVQSGQAIHELVSFKERK